jgi:hypothetical protein
MVTARAIAPTLFGFRFEPLPDVVDRRPLRVDKTTPSPPTEAVHGALWADLNPPPLSVWDKALGYAHRPLGSLDLEGSILRLELDASEPVEVDLEQKYTVNTDAWLSGPDTVELEVTVHQGGARDRRPLAFRIECPQGAVSARVPLKQGTAPFVASDVGEHVWAALADASLQHGRELEGVSFGSIATHHPVSMPAEEEVAEQSDITVARGR